MSEVWTKWQGYVINGEYPLQRYLGGSDQGAVFLTEIPGREPAEAAIKLVPAHPTFAELLLARWKAAADLPHPNLMQLLDGGQFDLGGQPFAYVVMEYADQQLAQLLEHRSLSEAEAREMLLPVLDALAFLHNRNLVQGQLKPTNILVVGDQIRLASDTIRPVSATFASTNIASVYDPPEVQDGSISTAGDIWALGVTLFEALTRTTPLGLENGRAGAALPPEFSTNFREIVSWCLKRRPFDRPKVAELEAKVRGAVPEEAWRDAAPAQADEELAAGEEPLEGEELAPTEEQFGAEELSDADELSRAAELLEGAQSARGAEFSPGEREPSEGEEASRGEALSQGEEASRGEALSQGEEASRGEALSQSEEPPQGEKLSQGAELTQGAESSRVAEISRGAGSAEVSASTQVSKAAELVRVTEIVVTSDSFSLGETSQPAERSPPSSAPGVALERSALSAPRVSAAPSPSASGGSVPGARLTAPVGLVSSAGVAPSQGAASGEVYEQFLTADELGVPTPRAVPQVSSGRTSTGASSAMAAGAAVPARGQPGELPVAPARVAPPSGTLAGSTAASGRHPALQLPSQQSVRQASSADAGPTGPSAGSAPLPRSATTVGAAPDARGASVPSAAPIAKAAPTPGGAAPVARSASVAGSPPDLRSASAGGVASDARTSAAGAASDVRAASGAGAVSSVRAAQTPGPTPGDKSAPAAGAAPVTPITKVTSPGTPAPAARAASSAGPALVGGVGGTTPTARSPVHGGAGAVAGAAAIAGGGASVSGGASKAGGTSAASGTPSAGGAPGTGGAPSTGGMPGTGGVPSAGGAPGTRGAPSTGGMPGTGSAPNVGGVPIAGGVPVARGAPAAGATRPAEQAVRSAGPGPTGVRTPTVPPAGAASSAVLHSAAGGSSPQRTRVTPLPPIGISKPVAREGATSRPTAAPPPPATPQSGASAAPVVPVVSKTIEFKKPNLEETPSDAAADLQIPEVSKRPPYVLLLVAVCVLIVGWVVVQGLGTSSEPEPVAAQPAPPSPPPPPDPVASEPSTLVREVPKPLLVSTAPNTMPQRAEAVAPPPAAVPVSTSTGIHEEIPEIPPRARRTIRGHVKVTVRLIVDKDGSVFAALVDNPGPSRYFERIAIDAAKKWTFPAVNTEDSRVEMVQFDFSSGGATGQAMSVQ